MSTIFHQKYKNEWPIVKKMWRTLEWLHKKQKDIQKTPHKRMYHAVRGEALLYRLQIGKDQKWPSNCEIFVEYSKTFPV